MEREGAEFEDAVVLSTTEFDAHAKAILDSVQTVIDGKPEAVRLALTVLLAEGHLLIEDVPGVGKTMLARALARSLDCSVSRIQFTPDLLPADITGVSVYNQGTREFEFKPGPVFANIVIGDEINRASPKTQSAMLESMEEGQVTVDGLTYTLATPFVVVATQNPIEMEGTYPSPKRSATGSWCGSRWATPTLGRARDAAHARADQPARQRAPGRHRRAAALHDPHHPVRVREPGDRAVRGRHCAGHPGGPRPAARRAARARRCSSCVPRRPAPPSTAATSCFRTTWMRSPSPCWPTASSRARRASGGSVLQGGSVGDIVQRIVAQTPVPLSAARSS